MSNQGKRIEKVGTEVANTIMARDYKGFGNQAMNAVMEAPPTLPIDQQYRVRKLTERECFKLMGVKQEDFEKIRKNQSKSSYYHLAGDSICCSVLMAIFGQMFDINWKEKINETVEEIIKEV